MARRLNFLTPGVFAGAIVVGGLLFAALVLGLWLTRPSPTPKGPATAVVKIIPAPSSTPLVPTSPPIPTPTPTTPITIPPVSGVIQVGNYVQVTGTGGDGLRVRAEPGLQGKMVFLAIEAEVLRVDDGPREIDGYTWWHLVAPYDEKLQGWAVANFLVAIQNP